MADNNNIPTRLFELIDQRDSGFFREDSKGMPDRNQGQLRTSEVSWVPNSGYRCILVKEEVEGNEIITPTNKEIRFIKNIDIIDKEEQDKRKIQPKPLVDLIEFVGGLKLISRQGSTKAEYDYLNDVFYHADAPNRPDSAGALYRSVDLNKKAEELADDDEDGYRAMGIMLSLKTKTGLKGDGPKFQYNEERIDGLCQMLGVVADTYAQKWYALSLLAKGQPDIFLAKVENFEQQILTEVSHAITLNVVVFDKNTAFFKEDSTAIRELGKGNLSQDRKMEALADFLKTEEGTHALSKMRTLTAVAKNKSLD